MGVIGGIFYDSYIKTHYPLIKIKRYLNFEQLINAIDNKEIDAFINESVRTWFQMVKTLNFN